jgi:hypothetical protein
MRRLVYLIFPVILAVYLACGSSQKNESKTSQLSASDEIHWVKFDSALASSATVQKPVLVYFWRDA